jgi:hypothetical protein
MGMIDFGALASSGFVKDSFVFLKPLVLFMLGIAVYGVFIFKFHRFVAKKRIFELKLEQYNTSKHPAINKFFAFIFFVIENIFVMPLFIFLWFLVFSVLITFLSKDNNTTTILLIAGALVGAIRICVYYSEDLAKDLAKLIPLALLGVFIADISYFNIQSSLSALMSMLGFWKTAFYYLIFIAALELVLHAVYAITDAFGLSIEDDEEK